MSFDAPEPEPTPIVPLDAGESDQDLEELARKRRELDKKRVGQSQFRVDPQTGLSIPGTPSTSGGGGGTGLRIPIS